MFSKMNEQRDTLIDRSDMHVLDFNVSLKTLCLIAVKEYNLDDSLLPCSIRYLIDL